MSPGIDPDKVCLNCLDTYSLDNTKCVLHMSHIDSCHSAHITVLRSHISWIKSHSPPGVVLYNVKSPQTWRREVLPLGGEERKREKERERGVGWAQSSPQHCAPVTACTCFPVPWLRYAIINLFLVNITLLLGFMPVLVIFFDSVFHI